MIWKDKATRHTISVVFAPIILAILLAVVVYAVSGEFKPTFTFIGFSLQLWGIVVTIKGLHDIREQFAVRGPLEKLISSVRSIVELAGPWGESTTFNTLPQIEARTAQAKHTVSGTVTGHAAPPKEAEDDELTDHIRKRFEEQNEQFRELRKAVAKVKKAQDEVAEKLNSLQSVNNDLSELSKKLEKAVTGNLHLDTIGLWGLFLGTVILLVSELM